MNLPKKIIDRNIYELNEKGELIKIRKSEGFLFTGNNDYQIKAIETIKKVNYLPVVLNKQTYYLSLKDYDYLPLMENWEVYIAIIEKMKRRYSQLKPNVRFPGLGYTGGEKTIEWQWFNYEYLGCEGGRNVYNVYFSFKLDKSIYSEDRINITWIDDSFFYTPKELQAIQDSIDMQMRKDSLEDYKAHAFTPVRKIFTASLEMTDTIFMYSKTQGFFQGTDMSISSADLENLRPVFLSDDHECKSVDDFNRYLTRRGNRGADVRKMVAERADSILSEEKILRLAQELIVLQAKVDVLENKYIQKQTFLVGKEYAYGDYDDFGLELKFFNCFRKTVKYINFETKAYNRFGDLQRDAVGKIIGRGRCIGPIEPKERGTYSFDNLYYDKNDIISRLCVTKLVITFTDNTTRTLAPVNNHVADGVYNKPK